MTGHWLFKSDPEHYSFDDLVRDKKTVWDGVSNNLALRHLHQVRHGDEVMIYHSGKERSIVGLAKAASDPYSDPKQNDPKLVVVDLEAGKRLQQPVSLDQIKSEPQFKSFELVRLPRLSVMPVPEAYWKRLLTLAGPG